MSGRSSPTERANEHARRESNSTVVGDATSGRPPLGTGQRCSQTTTRPPGRALQENQGSTPEASFARRSRNGEAMPSEEAAHLHYATNGEPHVVDSKTVSSRRERHPNAATARSKDLGFSSGVRGQTEHHLIDAFKKGTTSTDAAVEAQGARFPLVQALSRTATTTRGSPAPRRPHDRGDRPAPEPLVRPPTSRTPTVQGRRPGFPALGQPHGRIEGNHRKDTGRRPGRERPSSPHGCQAQTDLGHRQMGANGPGAPAPARSRRG